MDITAGNRRHNGGIYYPQVFDTVNAQLGIHNGQGVRSHLTATCGVINGLNLVAQKLSDLLVTLHAFTGCLLKFVKGLKSGLSQNVPANFYTLNQSLQLLILGKVVCLYAGCRERVCTFQHYPAPTLWPQVTDMKYIATAQ